MSALYSRLEEWFRSGTLQHKCDNGSQGIYFPGSKSEFRHTFYAKVISERRLQVTLFSRELNSAGILQDEVLSILASVNSRQGANFVFWGSDETFQFRHISTLFCDPTWGEVHISALLKKAFIMLDREFPLHARELLKYFRVPASVPISPPTFDPVKLLAALRSSAGPMGLEFINLTNPLRCRISVRDLELSLVVLSSGGFVRLELFRKCEDVHLASRLFAANNFPCEVDDSLLKAYLCVDLGGAQTLEDCCTRVWERFRGFLASFKKLVLRAALEARYRLVNLPAEQGALTKTHAQVRDLQSLSAARMLKFVRMAHREVPPRPLQRLERRLFDSDSSTYAGTRVSLTRVPVQWLAFAQEETVNLRMSTSHPFVCATLGLLDCSIVEESFQTLADFVAQEHRQEDLRTVLSNVGEALCFLQSRGAVHLNLSSTTVQVAQQKGGVCGKLANATMTPGALLWVKPDDEFASQGLKAAKQRVLRCPFASEPLDFEADVYSYKALLRKYLDLEEIESVHSLVELYSLV